MMRGETQVLLDRRWLIKLSTASLATAALGRSRAFAADRKRIAIAHPDRTANFYQGFMNSALEEAKKYDYEVLQSFSGMNPAKQLSEINTFLASGVDALVVLALDPNAMQPIVQKAHDRGALFISYANRIPGDDGFIKWADKPAGKAVGEHVVKHVKEKLGGKAKVGFLTYLNIQVVTDRMESVRAAILAGLPDTQIFQGTAVNAPDGLKATQSLLQAHPDIKVVVCCSDDAALGARSAYANSGLSSENIFIVGFDGAKQNLELIKQRDPFLQACAALDIGDIGRRVIDIPHGVWTKAPEDQTHVLEPYVLITNESDPAEIDKLLKVYPS
jgi:ribose transport system substrate-binding protein